MVLCKVCGKELPEQCFYKTKVNNKIYYRRMCKNCMRRYEKYMKTRLKQ